MAGRVFISYRPADTAGQAGWLFGRLAGHLGEQQVVKDVDPAQSGGDSARAIAAAVASCDALVLLIGHHWLAVTGEGVHDPDDRVRLEIEAALARDVLIVPVLVDGARMPVDGELPPSLSSMAGRPALELGPGDPDADTARLLQVLGQSIAERHATQLSPVHGQSTVPVRAPSGQPLPGHAPHPTKPMPPRRHSRTRTIALVACAVIAVAAAAFIAIPRGRPAPSASSGAGHGAVPKSVASSGPAASPTVLVTDDFSTEKINWTDDAHRSAGAYTGTGTYRLSVTGANGQSETARPAGATHGLSDVTPLNLSVSVDVRKLAGAPQGYGYGIAFRADGGGDVYAFLVMDHSVAIQKWVGGGAQVADSPAPVTATLNAGAADRLRAVCVTAADGTSVRLELWLNGKKLVDYTDRNHPYAKGYLGLYVESISDGASTAGAEFDNFTASQL